MSEIFCPECDKEISSYAKACPICGFPMADFLNEHGLTDFDKVWVCTKCGETYCDNYTKRPICEYCNTSLIQTDVDDDICFRNMCNMSTEDYANYQKKLALQYGDNFNQQFFAERRNKIHMNAERIRKEASDRIEKRLTSNSTTNHQSQSQPTNTPTSQVTCPYCQSTNTKKITAGDRVKSNILFGIFAKNRNKEWHCNSCNSDF